MRIRAPEWLKDPLQYEVDDNASASLAEARAIISSPLLNGSVVALEQIFEQVSVVVPEP